MSMADDLLFLYIRDNDAECPVCGYGLRALTTPVCPECGVEFELGILADDPVLRIWIAGLITVSLPTGFCVLFLVLLWFAFFIGAGVPSISKVGPLYAGAVLGSVAMVLLITQRCRFRAMSKPTRRWAVITMGLLMTGLLAYQVYLFF